MRAISSEPKVARGETPLVVDLDGTLLRSDLVVESLLILLKRRPWRLPAALACLIRGIAPFKRLLAREALPDVATLPSNTPLLEYLRGEKERGRRLVLATGADAEAAEAVAARFEIFDETIASDGIRNISGEAKRDALVARFGVSGFDYAGNGLRDLKIWPAARRAVLVGRSARHAERIARTVEVERVFADGGGGWKPYWQALRPGQWTKNLLLFLPLVMSGRAIDSEQILYGTIGWGAFCLCASSGYLFNDLMDLPSDRRHPIKKNRALAAGAASPAVALVLTPVLLALGLTLALLVSTYFALTVAAYYMLTVSYSARLKEVAILDVLILSGLYTIRLFGGTLACGVSISVWLLAFCIFLFLSLALVKRYAELMVMRSVEGSQAHARAFLLEDAELLAALGSASGYVAALVFVLYQVGRQVPGAINLQGWIMCLLYLYWISHMWLMAHRGIMKDDPLTFAFENRTSQVLMALVVVTFMWAAL